MNQNSYVESYIKLETSAVGAESKADEYRSRADTNRWEQCRIAHEACPDIGRGAAAVHAKLPPGKFRQRDFAKAVGASRSVISDQVRRWRQFGDVRPGARPTYSDACANGGPTGAERTRVDNAAVTHKVLRDPKLIREVLTPDVIDTILADPKLDEMVTAGRVRKIERKVKKPPVPDIVRVLDLEELLGKLGLACERVERCLPDYLPDEESIESYETDALRCEATAEFIRRWAKGEDITDDVEAFLKEVAES